MDIYTFEKVRTFLAQYGAESVYHAKRSWYFKTYLPELHTQLMDTTDWLTDSPTFTERLFVFTNSITERPKCGCGNTVTFSKHHFKYHTYCCQRCSIKDMKTLIGVDNPSQLIAVKEKKRDTFNRRYGVDNAFQILAVRKNNSELKKAYWRQVYENKRFTASGLTRMQYRHRCQQFANTQYIHHVETIDPNRLRGKDWHLDHIYSVTDGFVNEIPINVLSDISNLRLIHCSENYKKSKQSGKTLTQLYEDFNCSQCNVQ